jgi:hypothetical protein
MRRLRLALAVGTALVALGLATAPASAAPVVVTDRQGDGRGPGDLRALRIAQVGADFVFQVKTQQPLSIHDANAWTRDPSTTELRFNLDVPGGLGIDYALFVLPNQSDAGAGVRIQTFGEDRPTMRACDVTLGQPNLNLIRVRVSPTCINEPTRVRAFARYRLDQGGNGTIDSDDRAPNAGFSGFMDYVDD